MKRVFLGGLLSLVLAQWVMAQPALFYVNDGIVQSPPEDPPQVDALTFINNNFFSVNPLVYQPRPYYTAHTLNFTNRGTMEGNLGFDLRTYDPEATPDRQFRWAESFHNIGTITVAASTNSYSFGSGLGKVIVAATNLYSPGSFLVGEDCFLSMHGGKVDLGHSLVVMEGFTDLSPADNLLGLYSGYWGLGTNVMPNNFVMPQPQTPSHLVTDRFNRNFFQMLRLTNAVAYSNAIVSANGSNIFRRIVFLQNTNANMAVQVYMPDPFFFSFDFGFYGMRPPILLEWKWNRSSLFSTDVTEDYLYLLDDLGNGDDMDLTFVGYSGPRETYRPSNYRFYRGGPRLSAQTAQVPLQGVAVASQGFTNRWTAHEAMFRPTTVVPEDTAGQNATNLPGRIQIVGTEHLNLNFARIGGPNTMELTATNHFVGSHGAKIAVPLAQISLRNTNGWLTITNLMSPSIPRPEGIVDLYSGRWTNVAAGITNIYHVLFVDSRLSPTSPGRIQDLSLSATNVVISDMLNITRNFIFDGQQVTITTNANDAPTPIGGINLLSSSIIWSTSTPRLSYLTNHGMINTLNAVYFGGTRSAPHYNTNFNEPYEAFINRGVVTNEGSLIWSKYFDNSGVFHASSGSLTLNAGSAILTDGVFSVPQGDLTLGADDLIVSNHTFRVGRSLALSATNRLSDGVSGELGTNLNTWVVGVGNSSVPGFSLLSKPSSGDLLGTTVSNVAPVHAESTCVWAGEDRGCSPAGYLNNVAVGRLILDGYDNSRFVFRGAGVGNALYVDSLEFKNFMTNRNAAGDFPHIQIDPNVKIYFAQAMMNGESIAEKLDGRNGGRFCWVRDYAGFFSSTDVVYSDGNTYTFNAALVASCNLDSDGDGLVNCQDPEPIFVASQYQLTATPTNTPPDSIVLSWQTVGGASNSVWAADDLAASAWQWVTGFTVGAFQGPPVLVQYVAPRTNTPSRFYRVRVEADYSQ